MGNKKFINEHIKNLKRSVWDVILWKTGKYNGHELNIEMPDDFSYPAEAVFSSKEKPHAVWIGHSTYLIDINGFRVLTDPVWSSHCSPLRMKIFRRYTEPPFFLNDLASIDLVLISHNHYDHLDAKTVSELNGLHPEIEWVVPERLSPWFRKRGIEKVRELSWWKRLDQKGYSITAVPAQHFSGRGLWDQNQTHWNGYVLEACGKKVYFTGDTGYNPYDFKQIGRVFNHMDLSLIPIGTYVPKKFMEPVHISPFEAVQIHQDVGSVLSLGMHWNTFRLSDEPRERPPFDLFLAMQEKNLPYETFLPIDIGEHVNF